MEWQPIETARIPLTLGQEAIVDVVDIPLVERHSWHARRRRDGKGYYAVNSSGVRMHRLLLGVWDERIVDHKDGDGLNNRRANLRHGSQSQNCVNRRTTPGPHLRGARPKRGRWQSYIKLDGKQRSLGYYDSEADAHEAYLAEAKRMHGDWMPLPEPPHV